MHPLLHLSAGILKKAELSGSDLDWNGVLAEGLFIKTKRRAIGNTLRSRRSEQRVSLLLTSKGNIFQRITVQEDIIRNSRFG